MGSPSEDSIGGQKRLMMDSATMCSFAVSLLLAEVLAIRAGRYLLHRHPCFSNKACSTAPVILVPPVNATVCINSTATFTCTTDGGDALSWIVNGSSPSVFPELTADVNIVSGMAELSVPGLERFLDVAFVCRAIDSVNLVSTDSDPVYVRLQGRQSV